MNRISLVLALRQFDNQPETSAAEHAELIRNESLFIFPFTTEEDRKRINHLQDYQYLVRMEVFYFMLMGCN